MSTESRPPTDGGPSTGGPSHSTVGDHPPHYGEGPAGTVFVRHDALEPWRAQAEDRLSALESRQDKDRARLDLVDSALKGLVLQCAGDRKELAIVKGIACAAEEIATENWKELAEGHRVLALWMRDDYQGIGECDKWAERVLARKEVGPALAVPDADVQAVTNYDAAAATLYLSIGAPVPAVSEDIGDGVLVRRTDGHVVGFTLVGWAPVGSGGSVSCSVRGAVPTPEPEDTGGERCQHCGRRYLDIYQAPDAVWAMVTGRTDGGGLLCRACLDAKYLSITGTRLYWACKEDGFPGEPAQDGPNWACTSCGNTDPSQFSTVKYDTPGEPVDYDMKCSVCGSTEVEESPAMALHRVLDRADQAQPGADTERLDAAEHNHRWNIVRDFHEQPPWRIEECLTRRVLGRGDTLRSALDAARGVVPEVRVVSMPPKLQEGLAAIDAKRKAVPTPEPVEPGAGENAAGDQNELADLKRRCVILDRDGQFQFDQRMKSEQERDKALADLEALRGKVREYRDATGQDGTAAWVALMAVVEEPK